MASDAAQRRELAQRLTSAGYELAFADSALTQLQSKARPRAVLVHDAAGDRADSVLALIRARHPGLCTIIVTGSIDEKQYARLLSLGATACVHAEDIEAVLVPLLESNLAPLDAPATRAPPVPPAPTPATTAPATPRARSGTVSLKIASWAQYALLYTSDLSKGGLFIRMPDPPPLGTALQVKLGLPGGEILELRATVVHVLGAEKAAAAGKHPGVGVGFSEWGDALKQRFADLHQNARQSAPVATPAPPQAAGRPAAPPVARPPAPPAPPAVARPPAAKPPAPPPSPPVAGAPPAGKSGAVLAGALKEHLEELRRMDHFAALGLPPDADATQIRKTFLALAKEWHPGRFALEPEGVRELVAEIFISLKSAHDEIAEDDRRAAYKARLARRAQQGSVQAQLPAAPWVYTPPPAPSSASVVQPRPAPGSVAQPRPTPGSVVQPRPAPGSVAQPRPAPPRPPAPPPPPPAPPPKTESQVPPLEDLMQLDSLSLDNLEPLPGSQADQPLPGLDIGVDVPIDMASDTGTGLAPAPAAAAAPPPPSQHLQRVDHFIKGGFFRAAQQALERILLADPDNPILRARLAVAGALEAQRRSDFEGAARLFREAVDLNPTDELAVEGLRAVSETKKEDRRGIFKRLLSR